MSQGDGVHVVRYLVECHLYGTRALSDVSLASIVRAVGMHLRHNLQLKECNTNNPSKELRSLPL